MVTRHDRPAVAFWAMACVLLCSCSHDVLINGVPNLVEVSDRLARGGQPESDGWLWLRLRGYTDVIKLNSDEEGDDWEAVRLGMTVHAFPMHPRDGHFFDIWDQPERWQMDAIETEISQALLDGGRRVFVHCSHGHDRTGLVMGVRRVIADHWSKHRAHQEMLERGFHERLVGLENFWEAYEP